MRRHFTDCGNERRFARQVVNGRVRRGFTLVEVSAAAAILALCMALTVQVVGWVGAERRIAARRQWALREADNLMERLTIRPWESLKPDGVDDPKVVERIRSELPDGRLKIEVSPATGDPAAKRVRVEIRWKNKAGNDDAPVQVTAWIYQPEGGR